MARWWRSARPGRKACSIFEIAGDTCSGPQQALPDEEAAVYEALVMAVRDYFRKNGFKGAHLGLSGGIDSALTLAIAVDALGADKVHAVMMPSDYTADISVEDSRDMVRRLGVRYYRNPHQADIRRLCGAAGERIRRPGGRHDGREPAGAHARHAAYGAVEQVRHAGADHRQQERNGGRLRDAVWRHGGWLRGAEGRGEDPRVPAGELPQPPVGCGRSQPHSATHHRPSAVGRTASRPDRPGQPAALRRARRDSGCLCRARPVGTRHRRVGV